MNKYITLIQFGQIVLSLKLRKMHEIRALIQLPEFIIFSLGKNWFLLPSNLFLMKTGFGLIEFDVIFPIQGSIGYTTFRYNFPI